jgi:hypothetical protein
MLGGLLQAALGVSHPTQLSRQPKLSEAGPGRPPEGHTAAGAGDRQGNRQIASGLVHPYTPHDVDEDVRATGADLAVAGEDRQDKGEAIAI